MVLDALGGKEAIHLHELSVSSVKTIAHSGQWHLSRAVQHIPIANAAIVMGLKIGEHEVKTGKPVVAIGHIVRWLVDPGRLHKWIGNRRNRWQGNFEKAAKRSALSVLDHESEYVSQIRCLASTVSVVVVLIIAPYCWCVAVRFPTTLHTYQRYVK